MLYISVYRTDPPGKTENFLLTSLVTIMKGNVCPYGRKCSRQNRPASGRDRTPHRNLPWQLLRSPARSWRRKCRIGSSPLCRPCLPSVGCKAADRQNLLFKPQWTKYIMYSYSQKFTNTYYGHGHECHEILGFHWFLWTGLF